MPNNGKIFNEIFVEHAPSLAGGRPANGLKEILDGVRRKIDRQFDDNPNIKILELRSTDGFSEVHAELFQAYIQAAHGFVFAYDSQKTDTGYGNGRGTKVSTHIFKKA